MEHILDLLWEPNTKLLTATFLDREITDFLHCYTLGPIHLFRVHQTHLEPNNYLTINYQVTKIVMNSGSQLSEL